MSNPISCIWFPEILIYILIAFFFHLLAHMKWVRCRGYLSKVFCLWIYQLFLFFYLYDLNIFYCIHIYIKCIYKCFGHKFWQLNRSLPWPINIWYCYFSYSLGKPCRTCRLYSCFLLNRYRSFFGNF